MQTFDSRLPTATNLTRIPPSLADRSSLQPSAFESHTHLAHSVVRYLGVASPQELEPYGLKSAGDLVDLISRVSLLRPLFNLAKPLPRLTAFVQVHDEHIHPHRALPDPDRHLRRADRRVR